MIKELLKNDEKLTEDYKLASYVINNEFKKLKADFEDLMQECLISLYLGRRYFNDNKGSYSTYAYKICKNACLGYVRARKTLQRDENISLQTIIGQEEKDLLENILPSSDNIEDIDFIIDFENAVKKVFKQIAIPKKERIYKLILLGNTSKEIAHKVDCSISYVNRLKDELHTKLKKYMGDK